MRKFLGIVGISSLLVAAPLSAFAADMPLKAKAPPPAPAASWTGCYVGGNAGGIIGAERDSLGQGGEFLNAINIFSNPANTITSSYNSHGTAFTGGGQFGCNWQTGTSFVWGFEGDINGATRFTTTKSFGPLGPFAAVAGNNPGALLSSRTESVSMDLNWFSTFRGRLGFLATPTLLLYGTGGLAVAEINSSTNVVFGTDQFFLSGGNFAGSSTTTRVGWTVGVGAEWMFAPHWSVKAEYMFLDFGSFGYNSPCLGTSTPGACAPGTNFLWTTNVRAEDHIARVGVNYHFGWPQGPVLAKY